MKPRFTNHRKQALTFFEVLVIIACVALLLAMLLPMLAARSHRNSWINCISNLKQVNLALRIWEGDNNNEYPMQVSTNNGGGKEWLEAGDVADCFRAASNELSTPKILICPKDTERTYATNFADDFNNSHISYFLCADVTNDNSPQMVIDGDSNLELNGKPVKNGLLDVSQPASISWTRDRHQYYWGNLGFADGSVTETSSNNLQQALQQTGLATNRLAIP